MNFASTVSSSTPARSAGRPLTVRRVRARVRPASRAFARELARLRGHFEVVLAELRGRDVTDLSPAQRAARTRLIGELARYARAGRFPRNLDFPGEPTPYFVDAFGTRCAMARLIESTGAVSLVARISATANNARIAALAADAELLAWLDGAGLTAAEAARIQPSYCFVNKADACFCTGTEIGAVIEATVRERLGDSQVDAEVTAIHGDGEAPAVGDTIRVDDAEGAAIGDVLLATGVSTMSSPPQAFGIQWVTGDETVALDCEDVPALAKDDAIAALLAPGEGSEPSPCSEHLAKVDAAWGESQCEDSGGGCSITDAGAGAPWMLGTLLLVAVERRRRRAARRRT